MPRPRVQGEAAVLKHMPDAVILRPSIIFGPEDEFFNRFAGMTRLSPVLPVVGGDTQFQPVYVDDVAQGRRDGCDRGGQGRHLRTWWAGGGYLPRSDAAGCWRSFTAGGWS